MIEALLIFVVAALLLLWIEESVSRHFRKKYWVNGENFDPDMFPETWNSARLKEDRDKVKFRVRYEPDGDYFVDESDYAYLPKELYIKKPDDGTK